MPGPNPETVPSWPAGHIITDVETAEVTGLLQGTGPSGGLLAAQAVAKATSTTYAASSTTFQNDPDLVSSTLVVNGVYIFDIGLYYSTVAAALLKVGFTFPAGSSWTWDSISLDATVTAASSGIVNRLTMGSGAVVMGCNGVNIMAARIGGTLTMGATAGKLQLQAAQSVSNATAPTISIRSRMRYERIA